LRETFYAVVGVFTNNHRLEIVSRSGLCSFASLREILSLPFFFLEKKETKIQGCIKKAKIFILPLQRTILRSAVIQLSAIASPNSIYSSTCSLLNASA